VQTTLGLFGKIPAHGDFVERNLQRSFSLQWDDWLQRGMASSREQLGSHWLDAYLTSPIWRFCLSVGAVDSLAWAGILMPSVDSVGRYYPLTVAQPVACNNSPFEFLVKNKFWYASLEEVALSALHDEVDADGLIDWLQQLAPATDCTPASELIPVRLPNGWVCHGANAANHSDANLTAAYTQLLHQAVTPQYDSQSLWWSGHSQIMTPTCLYTQGLPTAQQFSALLDGRWKIESL
jgi:type VI secretion system protein ImpM